MVSSRINQLQNPTASRSHENDIMVTFLNGRDGGINCDDGQSFSKACFDK